MIKGLHYVCEFCGAEFASNGYFQHVRACAKKPVGATRKLYPIELPESIHRRFLSKCRLHDQTLAERVWELIEIDIRRNDE
jgi:hypothetical protein